MPGTPLHPRAFALLLALSFFALLAGVAARADDHNALYIPANPVEDTPQKIAFRFGGETGQEAATAACGSAATAPASVRRAAFVGSVVRFIRGQILSIYLLPIALLPDAFRWVTSYRETCTTWEVVVGGAPDETARAEFERGCREGFEAAFRECNGL